ncbi:unnamed protein product, partial [Ascophyllum nodosum]
STEAGTVEAGTLITVTIDAPLYDTNTADDNGCDPTGCVGEFTRDGDVTPNSRWSCKPSLGPDGSTCSIKYSLADVVSIEALNIALYKGDERTRTIEIYVDDVLATSWTSSGTTAGLEIVDLDVIGQEVILRGVLDDSEWLSVKEVEILVDDGTDPVAVEAGTLGTVKTVAALYDTRLFGDNGCDPVGCTAALTRDGDLAADSRWSCAPSLGGECTISYDLGVVRDLSELRLAMYQGTTRTRTIEVYVDGALITTWTSSGTTDGFESVNLSWASGQVIELTGVLANTEWFSIIETKIMVISGEITPPTPTPTLESPQPVVMPTQNLEPVGRIPLARGDSDLLNTFYVKDGDLSTAWTCTADGADTDDNYQCLLYFNLFTYRHVIQVKIALTNGAGGVVDMRIGGRFNSNLFEEFVTSSGTTDDFETYDYDYFTNIVSIAGVFTSPGGSISISEMEIVEEVQPGEVSVSDFATPYDNGDGLWNEVTADALEWTSDAEEAWDRKLTFSLSTYSTLNAVELQFPTGETYIFDLQLYDGRVSFPRSHFVWQNLESADAEGWQSFDVSQFLSTNQYVTVISLVMRGTGSGAPGFYLLDARFIGVAEDNPTNQFFVASTFIETWENALYPDFVAERSGDQAAIMQAICAAKKASFDGVDCVGEDAAATGTVTLPLGDFLVNGNIYMKSGVSLEGRYTDDDAPFTTDIQLDDDAAGNTAVNAIIVMDGISDAKIEDLWIRGLYDPETSNSGSAVDGLGSTCVSITGSQNITCEDIEIRFCDGDAMVVSDSKIVNIDADRFDDEFSPWTIGRSRGTGLVVDTCDAVWVRRHAMWDNGVAGIRILGSNNFTFEATFNDEYSSEGEGYVGSTDGQQPIEVIVESSTLVTFHNMSVRSTNDPVMTVSADSSAVIFDSCGFSRVDSGTCVIEMGDPSVVTAKDDELTLVDNCYIKV